MSPLGWAPMMFITTSLLIMISIHLFWAISQHPEKKINAMKNQPHNWKW